VAAEALDLRDPDRAPVPGVALRLQATLPLPAPERVDAHAERLRSLADRYQPVVHFHSYIVTA